MSRRVIKGDGERVWEFAPDRYIGKPFLDLDLPALIRKVTEKRAARYKGSSIVALPGILHWVHNQVPFCDCPGSCE